MKNTNFMHVQLSTLNEKYKENSLLYQSLARSEEHDMKKKNLLQICMEGEKISLPRHFFTHKVATIASNT